MIHIYTGNGKGKTTAAVGLSIRCAGSGGQVIFAQFLKDRKSSELKILENIEEIQLELCEEFFGFYSKMKEETRGKAREAYSRYLRRVIDNAIVQKAQMLILDEIIPAYRYDLVEREYLIQFLQNKPEELEVVMTGRNPEEELVALADYVSEIVKIKHPYDKGLPARVGIER